MSLLIPLILGSAADNVWALDAAEIPAAKAAQKDGKFVAVLKLRRYVSVFDPSSRVALDGSYQLTVRPLQFPARHYSTRTG
ncbi:MAG: hypothetical protein AAF513_19620 [Pseudomonadota bacterium]